MSACVVLVALGAIGLRTGPAQATAAARVPPDSLGLNAQHVAFGLTPAERATHLAAISAGGVRVVRSDLLANVADDALPLDGAYDWGAGTPDDYDAWVTALATAGIRWAPGLNGSPSWARLPGCAHTCSPLPAWFDDWAAFAAAAVGRYGPGGTFWTAHPELPYLPAERWEVWNEPNLGWSTLCNTHVPGADPAPREYAVFFSKVEAAIHAESGEAEVVIGGLADIGPTSNKCGAAEFARGMHAQDPTVFTRADGIALHEYQPTPDLVRTSLSAFRDVLDHELGGGLLDLHLNEVGWGTAPGTLLAVTEATRGDHLREVADTVLRSRCGVASVLPYAWRTPERDPVVDAFDWFGIADRDGTPKPSGEAYLDMVRTLQGEGATAPDPSVFEGGVCAWRAGGNPAPGRSITYGSTIHGVTDLRAAGAGRAGWWLAHVDGEEPAYPAPTQDRASDGLPAWVAALNHSTGADAGRDAAALQRGCLPGYAFRSFSQDGPARSAGGFGEWAELRLPDGTCGLSGAIVDPFTFDGSEPNTNNTVNRLQLRGEVPATFYVSVVTDSTAGTYDSGLVHVRGNAGALDTPEAVADAQVEPVFPQPLDVSTDGVPDLVTYRVEGFTAGDYLKIRLRGQTAPAGLAGVLFDLEPPGLRATPPDPCAAAPVVADARTPALFAVALLPAVLLLARRRRVRP